MRNNRSDITMEQAVVEWEEMSDTDLKAGSLFDSLTQELLSGSEIERIAVPEPEIIEAINIQRDKQPTWDVDFEELCISSRSSWDRYTRQLTPDLPTFLADVVSTVARARQFRLLWVSLLGALTPRQIEQLARWYRFAAKLRTQGDIAPSYFQDGSEAVLT